LRRHRTARRKRLAAASTPAHDEPVVVTLELCMNRLKSLLPALAMSLAAASSASAQPCATVEIDGVRPHQGHMMIAAFGSAETYGKSPLVSIRVPAGEATMRVQLCGLSGEAVALRLFQDLDSDGRMATNVLGMPNEPWGGSGSPGPFGPTWDSGKVALDGRVIAVRMSQ
jgi:uncharacterized protein (DUF2141 family)